MFNFLSKKLNSKKGFTLVELIIVITIIAVLSAVLVPTMSNIVGGANSSAARSNARAAYSAANTQLGLYKINGEDITAEKLAKAAEDSMGGSGKIGVRIKTENGVVLIDQVYWEGISGSLKGTSATYTPSQADAFSSEFSGKDQTGDSSVYVGTGTGNNP